MEKRKRFSLPSDWRKRLLVPHIDFEDAGYDPKSGQFVAIRRVRDPASGEASFWWWVITKRTHRFLMEMGCVFPARLESREEDRFNFIVSGPGRVTSDAFSPHVFRAIVGLVQSGKGGSGPSDGQSPTRLP